MSITESSNGNVAVSAVDISKNYGEGEAEVRALCTVSMDVNYGEFVAVMGPSGSGKSTLMHLLAGLDKPTEGSVYIEGLDVTKMKDKDLTMLRRERVGFVFQAFNLIPTLSALENITLPLTLAHQRPDPAWLDEVVRTVDLGDRLRHRPSELSGGQQQRVAIARALVNQPRVILADEPTGNLDSRASEEVMGFLRRAVDDFGQTIVMVTHDPLAAAATDRVVYLADGRIVDDMRSPTADSVFARMKRLGG